MFLSKHIIHWRIIPKSKSKPNSDPICPAVFSHKKPSSSNNDRGAEGQVPRAASQLPHQQHARAQQRPLRLHFVPEALQVGRIPEYALWEPPRARTAAARAAVAAGGYGDAGLVHPEAQEAELHAQLDIRRAARRQKRVIEPASKGGKANVQRLGDRERFLISQLQLCVLECFNKEI